MQGIRNVAMPVVDAVGKPKGSLRVRLLPSTNERADPPPLVDLRSDLNRDTSLEPIQLLEGQEYIYEIDLDVKPSSPIRVDRPEVFNPDDEKGDKGRLRPGLYTGALPVSLFLEDTLIGTVAFEVRSRKLHYLRHYRWMLNDIAEGFSEVVMERFAPSEQRFRVEETQDARTLYERFAFLKSLISGESFEEAIQQIISNPHRAWIEEQELRRPGQGIPATSAVARQLSKPGPHIVCPVRVGTSVIKSLPESFTVARKVETLDTQENRFIKFAFITWQSVIMEIGRILEKENSTSPVERGLAEVRAVLERIDSILVEELFLEIGELSHFPAESQVLQKREGYRDIFRAYILFEVAAILAWQGGEDVYSAGQRDVATLYEYWVFLQLANVVSDFCDIPFDWGDLLQVNDDGLNVLLRRGHQKALSGVATRLGRKMSIELWFNHTFGTKTEDRSSWTRPMRPDCSLLIKPAEECLAFFNKVWLHFDAKYRVETFETLFGKKAKSAQEEAEALEDEQVEEAKGASKHTDLLKMHAYHDAIRRSAGAFIIYPGDSNEKLTQYHEILPGIGAFALRPAETGNAEGTFALVRFIDDVLDHVASQITQHERWRYWTEEIYRERNRVDKFVPASAFLSRPPADTLVLLGYVKNRKHLQWIHDNRRYNLRGDRRRGSVGLGAGELGAHLVLLYGPEMEEFELWSIVGEPELTSQHRMRETGYPSPRGELYYCFSIRQFDLGEFRFELTRAHIERVRSRAAPQADLGAPVTITWLELIL